MALPAAIQAQVDEADRLIQQGDQPNSGDPPNPSSAPPPDPEPAAPANPDVAAPAAVQQDGDAWRQKYETLRGKYNAEVPQLQQQIKDLSAGYMQLQQQLLSLKARPADPPPQPEPPLVTTKDEETFGSDLVDMSRRVAREESRAIAQRVDRIEGLIRQLAPQVERVVRVEKDVASSRSDMFYAELRQAVPDFEAVNADPQWLAWLAEFDPIAGKVRQACLDEAAAAFDHRRVAAMFTAFKAAHPAQQPAASPRDKARSDLARQVAPSRSSSASAAPPGEKTYTGADYTYWLDPRRVHDTPRDKLEATLADLERAAAEGRVKW